MTFFEPKAAERSNHLWPVIALLLLGLNGCGAVRQHRSGLDAMESGDYAKGVAQLKEAADMSPEEVSYRKDWLRNKETATQRLLAQAENAHLAGMDDLAEAEYRIILKFDRGNSRAIAGMERLARIKIAAEDAALARAALGRGEQRLAAELTARALENDPAQADARTVRRELDALQAKQSAAVPTLDSLYKKPINLEFRDASLKMVFDALTRTTGINFIFDRDARSDQRTTVLLKQTTLEDAIDVILITNQMEKKILNSSSVLIYAAGGAKAKEYQDLMVRAFYLSSAEAKNTAALLKSMLKIKEIFVDEKMNMLVLREPADTIALAEKLIALHDLDQPEVMLEVEVLEVNRSRLLDLGIKLTDKLTITPLSAATLPLSEFASLGKSQLGITTPSATITANADNRTTNLLANPRIRVRDREKARFMIGDKVPIVTTTNTPNGFSSENIAYQDVGLKLEVEPEVRLRDEIGLRLSMEVSSLVSSIKTNNGSLAYQIGSRSVSSVLRLKDGETQVLAGLISDEDRSSANGLPFISELPILGRLFAAKQDNRIKTEIVLSITPHLIRNIQRKEPTAESFWSGTETNLRLRPLQVRTSDAGAAAGNPVAGPFAAMPDARPGLSPAMQSAGFPAPGSTLPAAALVPGAPQLRWVGPAQAKAGVPFKLELRVDSVASLRALPMQIGFDATLLQVLSVREGDYFSKAGPSSFSHNVDLTNGRISIGSASSGAGAAKGEGALVTVEFMPLRAGEAAQVNLISVSPIGQSKSVPTPALPVGHRLMLVP
jgi:general secretion pathway protein D